MRRPPERAWFAQASSSKWRRAEHPCRDQRDVDLAHRLHRTASAGGGSARPPDGRIPSPWSARPATMPGVRRSIALGLDYAVLGPVLPTPPPSRKGGSGLGSGSLPGRRLPIPVFALGDWPAPIRWPPPVPLAAPQESPSCGVVEQLGCRLSQETKLRPEGNRGE